MVSEIFSIDENAERMIVQDQNRKDLEEYYRAKKASFISDDAIRKVAGGVTTMDEIERVILSR